MTKSAKYTIVSVIIFAIILMGIVIFIYKNDYCLALKVRIDHNATLSFVGLIGMILTPAVGVITAILYYSSLREQQKQNFDMKWQHLLETQLKIRDSQEIAFKVLDNHWNDKIKHLRGYQCMLMAWMLYKDLIAVLRLKENCLNREKLQEWEDNYYNFLTMDDNYQTEMEYLR